jgi:hypothetical protein
MDGKNPTVISNPLPGAVRVFRPLLARLNSRADGRLRDLAEITRDLTRRCSSMAVKDDDPDEPDRLDQGRRMTCRL